MPLQTPDRATAPGPAGEQLRWLMLTSAAIIDEHTKGCLLVGSQAETEPGSMSITRSAVAYKKFYPQVVDAAEGSDLSITFLDSDR